MFKGLSSQNDPELIKFLKASTVAYTKAKYWEIRITFFLVFLALAYPVSYLLIENEHVKLVLFVCSFLLTVLVQLFTNFLKGNSTKGAIFKEEFDVAVFGLPWKSTIKRASSTDVSNYAVQYKKTWPEIKDWYSTNLSDAIQNNITIAVLQHSNTNWDIGLRKRFRYSLLGYVIGYSIALCIFLLIMNADSLTIFSIFFSVLSFYTHFFGLIRGHAAAIKKREVISGMLDNIIRNKKDVSMQELRDIQDEIFATRQEPAKVPNFFFRLFKRDLNRAAEDYIESVNSLYNK